MENLVIFAFVLMSMTALANRAVSAKHQSRLFVRLAGVPFTAGVAKARS
jgi:hypothetical protein